MAGLVLGILTGMRGLCNGLGPALFGLFFYFSNVQLQDIESVSVAAAGMKSSTPSIVNSTSHVMEVCSIISIYPLSRSYTSISRFIYIHSLIHIHPSSICIYTTYLFRLDILKDFHFSLVSYRFYWLYSLRYVLMTKVLY